MSEPDIWYLAHLLRERRLAGEGSTDELLDPDGSGYVPEPPWDDVGERESEGAAEATPAPNSKRARRTRRAEAYHGGTRAS